MRGSNATHLGYSIRPIDLIGQMNVPQQRHCLPRAVANSSLQALGSGINLTLNLHLPLVHTSTRVYVKVVKLYRKLILLNRIEIVRQWTVTAHTNLSRHHANNPI